MSLNMRIEKWQQWSATCDQLWTKVVSDNQGLTIREIQKIYNTEMIYEYKNFLKSRNDPCVSKERWLLEQ